MSYIYSSSSDYDIVQVAKKEVGNVGGEKFWKWYGFPSRVDWCCIFVSWCANQCGYIESGLVPKYSVVDDGANWFNLDFNCGIIVLNVFVFPLFVEPINAMCDDNCSGVNEKPLSKL